MPDRAGWMLSSALAALLGGFALFVALGGIAGGGDYLDDNATCWNPAFWAKADAMFDMREFAPPSERPPVP